MGENIKKANFFQAVGKFFIEVRSEMKKVVWPTWAQTVNNTMIVIVFIVMIGVFMAVIDFIFGGIVRGVVMGDFGKSFTDALTF